MGEKGNLDGLFISCVACMQELWAIIMDAGTGYSSQVYEIGTMFLPKDWIMEKGEEGYYITCMAGSAIGSSLVVMSKGTSYTQQSYKVSDSFPFKWINKKWKEGFYVTSMATSSQRWAVVMSQRRLHRPVRRVGLPVPLRGDPQAMGLGLPHHGVRGDARPGRLRPELPPPPPHGRDAGGAADVALPLEAREGEVGEESVHRRCRLRPDGELEVAGLDFPPSTPPLRGPAAAAIFFPPLHSQPSTPKK